MSKWSDVYDFIGGAYTDVKSVADYRGNYVENKKYIKPVSLLHEEDEIEEERRKELEAEYWEEVGSEFKRQSKKVAGKLWYEAKKEAKSALRELFR